MRYWIWQGLSGGVIGVGLDMTGLEFGWKFLGIASFIIWGTMICEAIAGERP